MHPDQTLLLAITGMSPAVVTETLYAMDRKGQQWPSAIKIITTSVGKKKACEGLLEEGYLNALCAELVSAHPETRIFIEFSSSLEMGA